ncbi:MAG: hypothetical protein GY934_25005, partial [Gammaproteobacteria bacterium]|nr:hypothetical protein [Gammaproteobacteria bacterium]
MLKNLSVTFSLPFRSWLYFFTALLITSPIMAVEVSHYDDPRIREWSAEYLAGKSQEVLKSVEADLLSSSPHPFSPQVWVSIHRRQGELESAWSKVSDSKLRTALGILPEIRILQEKQQHQKILDKFTLESVAEVSDPWALYRLADSAAKLNQLELKIDYIFLAAKQFPNHFQLAWTIAENDTLPSDRLRNIARERLEKDAALSDSPFGVYLKHFLDVRPWNDLDDLRALDLWLERVPGDGRALSARGFLFESLKRYERSLKDRKDGFSIFPFYSGLSDTNWLQISKTHYLLERYEEGMDFVKKTQRSFDDNPETLEKRIGRYVGQSLRQAGEKGLAREQFEAALTYWPEDADLLSQFAKLEMDDSRPDEAVKMARKAVAIDPEALDKRIVLVRALRSQKSYEDALKVIQQGRDLSSFLSESFYYQGSLVLQSLGYKNERLLLLDEGVGRFSGGWLQRERAEALWEADQKGKALGVLKEAVDRDPYNSWAVRHLLDWTFSHRGEADLIALSDQLIRQYPWQKALWQHAEERQSEKELWRREAIDANPGISWPWEWLIDYQLDKDDLQIALASAEEFLKTASVSSSYKARVQSLAYRAEVVVKQSLKKRIPETLQHQALDDLEKCYALGGCLDDRSWIYWWGKGNIYQSLGMVKEAAEAAMERVKLYPDSIGPFATLFDGSNSSVLGVGPIFGRAARLVSRNPFDGEKLNSIAQYHVQWGGSDIIGLRLIDRIKRYALLPASEYMRMEGRALGSLGDSVLDFERRYSNASNISSSDRYIGWYDHARKKVLSSKRNHVTLDFSGESPQAEILHPNGEVEKRVVHPITGMPTLIANGPAYIRAGYDPSGEHLVKLESSAGKSVTLEYDDLWQIVGMHDGQDRSLVIAYNEPSGKPNLIRLEGVGEMRVTYDSDGEVENVEAPEGGYEVSLQVTQAMQELESLSDLIKSAQSDIDSLPFEDETLDALDRAYEEIRWDDSDMWQASALALTRYLIDHIKDRVSHAERAREVLDSLIDTRETDEVDAVSVSEAVGLWHKLALITRPKGLSGEDFEYWSEIRAWLRNQVTASSDQKIAIWFEAVDRKPLRLLPDAQWLPDSVLTNSGFWQRHGLDRLLPQESRGELLQGIIMRRNGDLVVAGGKGISVLRKGYWTWFGFDREKGLFSPNTEKSVLDVSSDVLAVAESDDGVLWLGTGDGLIAMSGDYSDRVKVWRSSSDGLPSPRIDHLASDGDKVVVSTPAGVRVASLKTGVTPGSIDFEEGVLGLRLYTNINSIDEFQVMDAYSYLYSTLSKEEVGVIQEAEETSENAMDYAKDILAALDGTRLEENNVKLIRDEKISALFRAESSDHCSTAEDALALFELESYFSQKELSELEEVYETYSDENGEKLAVRFLAVLSESDSLVRSRILSRLQRTIDEGRACLAGDVDESIKCTDRNEVVDY